MSKDNIENVHYAKPDSFFVVIDFNTTKCFPNEQMYAKKIIVHKYNYELIDEKNMRLFVPLTQTIQEQKMH